MQEVRGSIPLGSTMAESKCHCGWDGQGDHPCHAMMYTCRKPAKRRFYNAQPAALAGAQMKFSVKETFACDECWEKYKGP